MIPISWTAHLQNDPEAKESLVSTLRNSRIAFTRLLEILEDKELQLDNKELSPTTYDSPAYPYAQAYMNGRRASIREIKDLLQFIKG